MIDNMILGFLFKKAMSGYEIKQMMGMSTGYFIDASYGSIYPALKKLEDQGLITAAETVENGKFKKIYTINQAGKAVFLRWLSGPIPLPRRGLEHLLRLFFFGLLPIEQVKELIQNLLADLKAAQAATEGLEPLIKDKADFFEFATQQFGKDFYRFMIQWYQDFLERLEDRV
ncbi:PadR family transcriptional regulator [Hydrogenispora ethanolica]|uniref:PadR family transcriptional regulator n=1 Tax=Hydrogenispora ethanolica TaxID=1082276 RepID=A0A4R1SA42_HYDET|nr:PadR family transcriptional regulator [Hydrogenispora ethanolica]TCL76366.1 PadR family transcriptional regulator [Hydrogenispora ethanolica]